MGVPLGWGSEKPPGTLRLPLPQQHVQELSAQVKEPQSQSSQARSGPRAGSRPGLLAHRPRRGLRKKQTCASLSGPG